MRKVRWCSEVVKQATIRENPSTESRRVAIAVIRSPDAIRQHAKMRSLSITHVDGRWQMICDHLVRVGYW